MAWRTGVATSDRLPGREELSRLYFDVGLTQKQIAAMYDVSSVLISRYFRRHGIEARRSPGGPRPTEKWLRAQLQIAGDFDVAEACGVRVRTLRRWKREYRIK